MNLNPTANTIRAQLMKTATIVERLNPSKEDAEQILAQLEGGFLEAADHLFTHLCPEDRIGLAKRALHDYLRDTGQWHDYNALGALVYGCVKE